MSSSDWEEVKRLAADFQRAQLTSASQRLTERNCIEIVNRLVELNLVEVIFTADGKEYVTPQHLLKEIQDELYVNGGRLSLVAIATNLNVSLAFVEAKVNELLKQTKSIFLVLGQLITTDYLDALCEDFNEKLVQDGVLSLSELSKTSDLPGEFLQDQVEKRLGKAIQGKQDKDDPSLVYTEAFVRRNTSRIRGMLSAITKPTPINQILSKFESKIPERLFFGIIDKLLTSKRINGILSGGGSSRSAYFIPASYTKSQIQWIEGFMNGNGYIDLDAASRIGISDTKAFILKRFPNQDLLFLKSCVLGESLFKQAKEQVEESLASPGWIDVSTILPASVTEKDVEILMDKVLAGVKGAMVFDSVIVNKSLLKEIKVGFTSSMVEKASKDISSGKYIQLINEVRAAEKKSKAFDMDDDSSRGAAKKDERRKKAAGGKAGGGTQGRETKTKSTKKKYMAGKKDTHFSDSDDEHPPPSKTSSSSTIPSRKGPLQLEFLTVKEISQCISKRDCFMEAPEEFLEKIAGFLSGGLQDEYQAVLKTEFDKFMSEKCGKKSQEEVLEKLFKMSTMLQIYIEGFSLFEGDVKTQLEKFLLRSFGQEIITTATTFVLMEAGLDENSKVADLPSGEIKDSMFSLGKAQSAEQFSAALEAVLPPIKKSSKNTFSHRNVVLETRESLLNELENAVGDPALYLHVASLILFSLTTDLLLQASGKFVPQIISFLAGKLTNDEHAVLKECQEKVVALIKLKSGSGAQEAKDELLSNTLPAVKSLIEQKK